MTVNHVGLVGPECAVLYRDPQSNPFEFVIVVAQRAKQLMAGCVPRVTPGDKVIVTASREVLAGKVARQAAAPLAATGEPPPALAGATAPVVG